MSRGLFVRRAGEAGPLVVFIHGSAADHATWVMQLASLPRSVRCVAYDRRGSGQSPPAPAGYCVEDHAADAAAVIEDCGDRAVVVGSSFGAVVALEVARSRPDLVAGAVLCEPPMPCADDVPSMPAGFGCAYDRVTALAGGEIAGAMFLRLVLGDAYHRLPAPWRQRAVGEWKQIRADALGLTRYRPRFRDMSEITQPVLLVGGTRSSRYFDATLSSLERALPRVSRVELAGGHMVHAEAGRDFNGALNTFVRIAGGDQRP